MLGDEELKAELLRVLAENEENTKQIEEIHEKLILLSAPLTRLHMAVSANYNTLFQIKQVLIGKYAPHVINPYGRSGSAKPQGKSVSL